MHAARVLALGTIFTFPAIFACSRTEVVRAPEGGHLITCDKGMKSCIGQAEKLCGDKGYTIVSGSSLTHMLGGESSSYRQVAQVGSLEVRCGIVELEEEAGCHELPPRTDAIDSPPVQADSSAGMRVCVPGATQRCVGVAACDGGQICLAEGQGFGPCDCGGSAPDATRRPASPGQGSAPQPAPSAPSESSPPLAPSAPRSAPSAPQVPGAMPAPTPLAP